MSQRVDQAIADVGKMYRNPEAVCEDARLKREDKIKLLKQWEYDLRELQVAAEENMTGPNMGQNAELLRSVRECLNGLGAVDDLELAGASKQGGA